MLSLGERCSIHGSFGQKQKHARWLLRELNCFVHTPQLSHEALSQEGEHRLHRPIGAFDVVVLLLSYSPSRVLCGVCGVCGGCVSSWTCRERCRRFLLLRLPSRCVVPALDSPFARPSLALHSPHYYTSREHHRIGHPSLPGYSFPLPTLVST